MWPVLIDSCRVRGVFSSALKLPSVQSAIEVVGGYCHSFEQTQASLQEQETQAPPSKSRGKAAAPDSHDDTVQQMVHRVYKIVILSQNLFQQIGQLRLPHLQAQLEQLTLIDPGDVNADNYLQIALAYLVQFN